MNTEKIVPEYPEVNTSDQTKKIERSKASFPLTQTCYERRTAGQVPQICHEDEYGGAN